MHAFTDFTSARAVEAEAPWAGRNVPATVHDALEATAARFPARPAISFQLFSAPDAPAETLSWADLLGRARQAANLFRSLGVTEDDVVAYILPNANETVAVLIGAMTAGRVNPINPLLDVDHIAGILNQTGAKVVVTLKAFPKTDVAQKAAAAVAMAPGVTHLVEIDLHRYLTGVKRLLVPFLRPKVTVRHHAKIIDFAEAAARQPADRLSFDQRPGDRIAAYFHTGGTTGRPKIAQHRFSGMIYNGWLGQDLLFTEEDALICPLPLFHCFACYPVLMSAIQSGAHVVFPTPAGYRGEGVFDNFWKLIERWRITFLITVPTALSALMQRPVDADVSSLKTAISGSAPLPLELYKRFEAATGVQVAEGYGLTEATCLVSVNPLDGHKKVGSVGVPLPYTDVRILQCGEDGAVTHECATGEVGEICIANPGVFEGSTYTEPGKNLGLFADRIYLRTGDLGRLDEDGYLWITGRKKDLIIRGGHNIDPAEIEEALMGHPAVAMVGAIGQPDQVAGELPCAYVELVRGAEIGVEGLMDWARMHVHERAAVPKYLEIVAELPRTAIGKVFKPELRQRAISRVYAEALAELGEPVRIAGVADDRHLGLTVELERLGEVDEARLAAMMDSFTRPWRWRDPG